MGPPKVIFVSGNANKLIEMRQILGDGIEVESEKLDITELQGTIDEIVKDKCRRAADIVGYFDFSTQFSRLARINTD
jgi:inosine triphosphate pyrophosphatase